MDVLIVDDSVYMRAVIRTVLIKYGHNIIAEAHNGVEAIDLAIELKPDLITLDNILPDMMGIDILKTLIEDHTSCKVIMISAIGQERMKRQALALGASAYIVKPFEPKQLIAAVNDVMFVNTSIMA